MAVIGGTVARPTRAIKTVLQGAVAAMDIARAMVLSGLMEWREEGMLLAVRPHGESAAIIEVFTAERGRCLGVVRGGTSRRVAPLLQPGAQLFATWKARLEEHLGHFTIEPLRSRAGAAMGDRVALSGLSAVCGLLSFSLPEREPHPALYARAVALLDNLGAEDWGRAYLGFERALLEETGFGLDLARCAVTGATVGLAYISPRTGRAVSREGAGDWASRLLPLPPALLGRQGPLDEAFAVTGHFLQNHLAPALGDRPLPAARDRLVALLSRGAEG